MKKLLGLAILCVVLAGCAGAHKVKTGKAISAKCVKLHCEEKDGCWYDPENNVVHKMRVTIICRDAASY